MISTRKCFVAAMLALVASACSDAPTSPGELSPSSLIAISAVPDPTLATFNSASCRLTNPAAGLVTCSWNISNPGLNALNQWAQAILTVSYDCVNPKNGHIASSEQRDLETLIQNFGVSDATLTGTNIALPATFLPTNLKGQDHKQNACKGNNVPMSLSYALTYWDISVITTTGTQRFSCFASDNRLGCFT